MEERSYGTYRATEYIGVPGRTQAYKAVNAEGADVVVMTAPVRSEADAERYAQRAQTAAALTHTDVARVTDWGREGDEFYAVQEWIPGK